MICFPFPIACHAVIISLVSLCLSLQLPSSPWCKKSFTEYLSSIYERQEQDGRRGKLVTLPSYLSAKRSTPRAKCVHKSYVWVKSYQFLDAAVNVIDKSSVYDKRQHCIYGILGRTAITTFKNKICASDLRSKIEKRRSK